MINHLSISRFYARFTWPHWSMCILALFGMVFFSSLGVWQLQRADEKKQILAREAEEKAKLPELWLGDESDIEPFKHVKFAGKFLPKVFFLDNQYHVHHIGYHVISPILMSTGRVLLLDRGWVPQGKTRQDLPDIGVPSELLDLSGVVYMPKTKVWLLGAGVERENGNQIVLESLDFALISKILHKSVYPFIIRLDKSNPVGFVRDWVTVVMPPARHLGYAFQWFALTLVVLVVFIALNSRKK